MRSIALFVFCIIQLALTAQTPSQNFAKYWHYRERFKKYFISIGTSPGESLPFAGRSPSGSCKVDNPKTYLPDDGGNGCIITDDLPDYIGWYLGVLGTEYKLVKDCNDNTDGLKYELFCALEALNRLDTTEAHIGNTALDGFLIREDLPNNFISTHPLLQNDSSGKWNAGNMKTHNGFIYECFHNNPAYGKWNEQALSKDHDIRLLMGLALIVKYVDKSVSFKNTPFMDGETSIKKEAQHISNRIIMYMKNTDWRLFMPDFNKAVANLSDSVLKRNCILGSQNTDGYITEPCRNCPQSGLVGYGRILVPRGCTPFLTCFPFAEAGNSINAEFNKQKPLSINFHDLHTTGNLLTWSLMEPLGQSYGDLAMTFILAAIGDSWKYFTFPLGNDATQKIISRKDKNHHKWGFYSLLYAALWEKPPAKDSEEFLLHRLNCAPKKGPDGGSFEWFSNNVFDNGGYNSNPSERYESTKWNGLDYMLAFNIYVLTHPEYLKE